MTGEVVRYNVSNGRFAIAARGGYIVAELLAGQVAEGMALEWDDPISSPVFFRSLGRDVKAIIVDVDVPGRELMNLLGPW